MKKFIVSSLASVHLSFFVLITAIFTLINKTVLAADPPPLPGTTIPQIQTGFQVPMLADVITFGVRMIFVVAGMAAVFYLMLGAIAWIGSSGKKDEVTEAKGKIQSAVVGLILVIAVLAFIAAIEKYVFGGKICFGISCPMTIPGLIQ